MLKRCFDLLLSIVLLLLVLPIFIVVGLWLKLDSKGTVLYQQERVGRHGITFQIYKFRSMVSNADQIGGYSTAVGDARITKVGAFLRKTSLDELPQILNVLLGDMSLVGPRPDVPAQQKLYLDQDWLKRTSVRPGLTGLAQATLRSAASPSERTRLDLKYVDQQSLLLDLNILWMTVRQVLGKGGF